MRCSERRAIAGLGALVQQLRLPVTLGFFLLFWNRFAGLRSGLGGFGGGMAILQGMPIGTISPPHRLFSVSHRRWRAGVEAVRRCYHCHARVRRFRAARHIHSVYGWLSRFFTARHSPIAAIVTMVASAGDLSEPVSSYNHETIMWAIASGYAASFAVDFDSARVRRVSTCAFLSGLLAGLSLGGHPKPAIEGHFKTGQR